MYKVEHGVLEFAWGQHSSSSFPNSVVASALVWFLSGITCQGKFFNSLLVEIFKVRLDAKLKPLFPEVFRRCLKTSLSIAPRS